MHCVHLVEPSLCFGGMAKTAKKRAVFCYCISCRSSAVTTAYSNPHAPAGDMKLSFCLAVLPLSRRRRSKGKRTCSTKQFFMQLTFMVVSRPSVLQPTAAARPKQHHPTDRPHTPSRPPSIELALDGAFGLNCSVSAFDIAAYVKIENICRAPPQARTAKTPRRTASPPSLP